MKIVPRIKHRDDWWKEFSQNLYRFLQFSTTFDKVQDLYDAGVEPRKASEIFLDRIMSTTHVK